jgi:serine/threonine protein kinase
MPPELFQGNTKDLSKVDIYSLGVVLASMITGKFEKPDLASFD